MAARAWRARAGFGHASGLDDDVDRQLHEQQRILGNDAPAALQRRQRPSACLAYHHLFQWHAGLHIGRTRSLQIYIGDGGDIEQRHEERLGHHGGGVLTNADDGGTHRPPSPKML